MTVTIYGDFNCPFSALASARADALMAGGHHQIQWRVIQHDTRIPSAGESVEGGTANTLAEKTRPMTPTLVLPDGYVSRGLGALARLAEQVYDHQGNHGQGTVPLLAIDAWEHAYYLQYLNAKGDFFDAVRRVVDWADVAERLAAARLVHA